METEQPTFKPDFKLFAADAVGIGTFLGSPLCGTFLLALNYFKLEKIKEALLTLGVGGFLSLLYTIIATAMPESSRTVFGLINIGLAFGFSKLAHKLFDDSYAAHEAAGGVVGLKGAAAGLGFLFLGLIFVTMFGLLSFVQIYKNTNLTCVTHADKERVCYTAPASEEDAQCVVDDFVKAGFFDGVGASDNFLRKEKSKFVLGVVINDSALKDKEVHKAFGKIRAAMEESCFSKGKLKLELLDANKAVKLTLPKKKAKKKKTKKKKKAKEKRE